VPIDFAALPPSALAVKPLWARRKVEDLELRQGGMLGDAPTPDDTARARIEKIGLDYRIMTKHTSFVAVLDQVRNAKGEWVTMQQLVELPEGLDTAGVMSHIPPGVKVGLIASRSTSASMSAYELLQQKFAQDPGQIVDRVSGTTGQTRVAGRRGKIEGGWNEGYQVGGSGGVDDLLGGLWGGDAGPTGIKARGGMAVETVKVSDLSRSQDSVRSTETILQVIRAHMPGLRHTFNKYQKTQAGLKGKLTLRIAIDAGGTVSEVSIVSTTTGFPAFDEEIRLKIATWKFEPAKGAGKEVVTVPFTFGG
jgi:TonB family protein